MVRLDGSAYAADCRLPSPPSTTYAPATAFTATRCRNVVWFAVAPLDHGWTRAATVRL